jgi:sulfite oxidase
MWYYFREAKAFFSLSLTAHCASLYYSCTKCTYTSCRMKRFRQITNSRCSTGAAAVLVGIIGGTLRSGNENSGVVISESKNNGGDSGHCVYTPDDVRQMDGSNGKPFWVTYRGEVFDLTKFRAAHPGGKQIEQAAGSDVGPFWEKWAAHFDSNKVKDVLKETKIGNLTVCQLYQRSDEYTQDPPRAPQRLYHDFCCLTPASSQTHPHILSQSFLTPNEALYIRNHAPVPHHLSAKDHDITFSLLSDHKHTNCQSKTKTLSLGDILERFDSTDVVSVMQCAGNRQYDDFKQKGINGFTGTPYQTLKSGMVGNVLWTGIRLDELLPALYPTECDEETKVPGSWHVVFTAADEYESSTPLGLVLEAATDGLLAHKMNGEALLPDHGYPVRAVLPGIAGARNVKWVERVTLSRRPSESPWNTHYYRDHKLEHIQKLPLNSIIFSPGSGSVSQLREDGSGTVSVLGVAYSGGENTSIKCVEVTGDGGKSWTSARLLTEERAGVSQDSVGDHSWMRFAADVPIKVNASDLRAAEKPCKHVIVINSRAIDSVGKVQPMRPERQRTYLYNGWGVATVTALLPSRS